MFRFLTFMVLLVTSMGLKANNIEVSNIVLTGQNVAAGTTIIQFDLSWENSWRVSVGPANYDAAWVFAKYRVNGGAWRHAFVNSAGTQPAGAVVDDVDQVGAFVYRATDGSGDLTIQSVQLEWGYGEDNVDPNAVVDVQVFAIEMVYVPEGEFSLGTGRGTSAPEDNETGEFYSPGPVLPFLYIPYRVTSEAAITVANSTGNLFYSNATAGSNVGDQLGPIPPAYPKGFGAFYCMKYETSQSQWVAFFNTLTQQQKLALDLTGVTGKNTDALTTRNGISWDEIGNATTNLPDVAVNYASTIFTLAYLDWAGLRPMTELEYEKAGRGPATPINNEFAWGNANIHATNYTYANLGNTNESITDPGEGIGNANYMLTDDNISGPARCGVFAASAFNANREETGGSYYGIMELTGNLYERVISAGNPEGRAFTGVHGDGRITNGGRHNVSNWPATEVGVGYRGGSYANNPGFIRLSDRNDASIALASGNSRLGFRGARSAN